MTAKEAICKNCGHGRNGHVDKWGGICVGCPCPGFELVNAAESLPAEPEQKLGTCMASFVLHTRGTYCIDWTPVAPVEAKEKCGATFEANMPWRICNLLKGHDSMHEHDGIYWVFDAREPKPTPPTPSEVEEKAVPSGDAATGTLDGYPFHIRKDIPEDTIWAGTKAGAYLILKYPAKPQPDSSSIDLKLWLDQAVDLLNLYYSGGCPKDVAKDFLEKCRENFNNVAEYKPFVDSSSISSEHHIVDAHEMVEMIDKTLSCTSGLSFGECLEEIKRRLGE